MRSAKSLYDFMLKEEEKNDAWWLRGWIIDCWEAWKRED